MRSSSPPFTGITWNMQREANDIGREADRLRRRIKAARGEIAPDLVLRGGRVIDVFNREIIETNVAVYDGVVVGLGDYGSALSIDARQCFISPGFIDGHLHIESSMLMPPELARAVLPHGTTAIVADPHEIANVMGMQGIRLLLDASRDLPVDFFFMAPSCVPATHLETAGARLSAEDILPLRNEKRVLGLAEMMNYPGVLSGTEDVLEKLCRFRGLARDGHAPLLTGRDLNAYVTAGIRSDHECSLLEEAREKMRLGMHIMIREGTLAKNLATLLPLASPERDGQCSLVTDDLHPHDILKRGHMNALIDRAVAEGAEPITAIRMATINTARFFGLEDRGAVAPGQQADLLILSSLRPVRVRSVIKQGREVFSGGRLADGIGAAAKPAERHRMNIAPYSPDRFVIPQQGDRVRVIGLVAGQILTRHLLMEAPVRDGFVVADGDRDLLRIAVLERHRATGNIGLGLVRGFGFRQGALASSVAHDSHNIICVGGDEADLHAAVRAVESMNGGMAAVKNGKVLASLPLPIAGLMSDRPLEEVAAGWESLREAARAMGCRLPEPFMALSFLALPVIPELRITDHGLVDVTRFRQAPLFVET